MRKQVFDGALSAERRSKVQDNTCKRGTNMLIGVFHELFDTTQNQGDYSCIWIAAASRCDLKGGCSSNLGLFILHELDEAGDK
jgi:hypothetical protein